jgi:hypothetical protein
LLLLLECRSTSSLQGCDFEQVIILCDRNLSIIRNPQPLIQQNHQPSPTSTSTQEDRTTPRFRQFAENRSIKKQILDIVALLSINLNPHTSLCRTNRLTTRVRQWNKCVRLEKLLLINFGLHAAQQAQDKAPNPFMENNANSQASSEQGNQAPTFLYKKGLLGRGAAQAGRGRG